MQDHWLARPKNIKLMWRGFLGILGLTVLSELLVQAHPYFGIDATFGFHAWYGFAACVVLIVGSKALGALLKRPDSHYD
jgi:hypothetical protein